MYFAAKLILMEVTHDSKISSFNFAAVFTQKSKSAHIIPFYLHGLNMGWNKPSYNYQIG